VSRTRAPAAGRPGSLLLAAFLAACSSCQALRDYATYRRVLAHEREFAFLEIARYDLRVEVVASERRARVDARILFANRGSEPVERIGVLLADGVRLGSLRDGQVPLPSSAEAVALGGFRATYVVVRGFPPIGPGEESPIDFDYELPTPPPSLSSRLEPTDGYLLSESLWVPTIRTPLSDVGMERAPCSFEVTLPEPLVPLGVADFEPVGGGGGKRTWRGATSFPFSPFLVYGEYARSRDADRPVEVHTLAGSPVPPRGIEFTTDCAAELRSTYERWFGAVDLPTTKVIAVRRMGGSWGAPGCLLIDDGLLPREAWEELRANGLLAHELAHTWWGSSVAMHGGAGYLHEGLANWCSAEADAMRYGPAARESRYEGWLVRYARGKPLRSPLGKVSILKDAEYERGAYLVGAHFYRALAERAGAEPFVDLLREFYAEHAFESADLDDLRRIARRRFGGRLDDLFEDWIDSRRASDALHRRGRAMVEERTAYWRARVPAPSEALRADVQARLERAREALRGAAGGLSSAGGRNAALRESLDPINAMPGVQVTVVDAKCDLAYHVQIQSGNVRGHRDLRGASVYGSIVESGSPAGSIANFDFMNEDLRAARENAIAWTALPDLGLWLVVEGHEWRAMEGGSP
jgi:peptidase M1-like protein